jgi:hypothetical protein
MILQTGGLGVKITSLRIAIHVEKNLTMDNLWKCQWKCFKYNELYIVTWNMLDFYGAGALN